ncbi:MAG: hypothetical protein Kow0032_12170 [Methyloligellaceae bacterium]
MRKVSLITLVFACSLLPGVPARAFEQVPGPAPAPSAQVPPGESSLPGAGRETEKDSGKALDLNSEKEDKGGFRLPGFGSFGLFPKLDFGLELLYADPPAAGGSETGVAPEADRDDVQIRGRLKKRF